MKRILSTICLVAFLLVGSLSFAGPTGTPTYNFSPGSRDALVQGEKNVTVAGTAVALGTSKIVHEILIQAKRTNTGRIYVGTTGVTNNDTAGIFLNAGEALRIFHNDMTLIFINSTVNGEGVTYLGW